MPDLITTVCIAAGLSEREAHALKHEIRMLSGPIGESESHPPVVGGWLAGLPSPSNWFTQPNIPVLGAAGTTAAQQQAEPFDFKGTGTGGFVIGLRASIINGSLIGVDRDSVELALQINQGENIITNGSASSFMLLSDLSPANQSTWSPVLREFTSLETWSASFRNRSPVVGVEPSLSYAFIRHDYPGADAYAALSKIYQQSSS